MLFQVQIITKPFVNTRIDVILLEKHIVTSLSNETSCQYFPLSAVRSRLKSTDGVSQRSLLTAAMHPASKFPFPALDHCSDSHLLGVSAVELDAPPVSSLIASPLSTISCSILGRHFSVCCPLQTQPGHPAVRPHLSKMFGRKYTLFARLPLSNSSFCWIVGFCCVLLAVAFHGLPTHRFKNCKHYHLPDVSHSVSSLHLLASTAEIHRCGQACRQKLLASTSCSTWLHPRNGFAPSTLLQMVQLLQRSPCPGLNDKAFSQFLSLGNCSHPMHNVVPSSPSTRDPVQLLSCISFRRLLEMPEAVLEFSNSLVLHAPSSLSSLLALQSQSELWIGTV